MTFLASSSRLTSFWSMILFRKPVPPHQASIHRCIAIHLLRSSIKTLPNFGGMCWPENIAGRPIAQPLHILAQKLVMVHPLSERGAGGTSEIERVSSGCDDLPAEA